jgi:hypothetical protein
MTSYSKFDSKKNPILVISDRNNGVYLLNIMTLKKSQIIEIDSIGDIKEQSKKKIKLTKNWRGNQRAYSPDNNNSSDSDPKDNLAP